MPDLWEAVGRMSAVPAWAVAAVEHRRVLRAVAKVVEQDGELAYLRQTSLASDLGRFGEFLTHIKMHNAAAVAHRLAWLFIQLQQPSEQSHGSAEIVTAAAALASALYADFQFTEALGLLQQVSPLVASLPNAAQAVVSRLESTIHECRGDFVSALYHLEHSQKLRLANDAGDLQELALHVDLLKRVVNDESSDMPPAVRDAMTVQLKSKLDRLTSVGPWELSSQLPSRYVPNLRAQPWHTVDDWLESMPQLGRVMDHLQHPDTWQPLLTEFENLSQAGFVSPERECIHVAAFDDSASGAGDNGDSPRAAWRRFELTGYWHAPLDGEGCASGLAPTGCALLHTVRQKYGLPVLRAGYSAIAAGGTLKPHHGMTNGQLKLHLGLRIPVSPKPNCAWFRVGNETRAPAWGNGMITFFDDSFEHEVHNGCDAERVVFQLVFLHPDLADKLDLGDDQYSQLTSKLLSMAGFEKFGTEHDTDF
eukprot:SAG31_NODE_4451_length_3220_cov_5.866709_3_plen_478_part_00